MPTPLPITLYHDTSDTLTPTERAAMAAELASHGVTVGRPLTGWQIAARAALIALGFVAFSLGP